MDEQQKGGRSLNSGVGRGRWCCMVVHGEGADVIEWRRQDAVVEMWRRHDLRTY